ncbi:MAG: cyanophycinase [Anaerolineales bacterium]|nr:cyanophycinase [Anaerolineales bacterium]
MTTTLIAIGGALHEEDPKIFREFIRLAGGEAARIVIFPQASGLAETGREYQTTLQNLGVREAPVVIEFRDRAGAASADALGAVREATGVFFSGGTQMRLSSLLGGTAMERELLAAYRRGAVVGGTSAGAAILSRVMIADGRRGATPRGRAAQICGGLGFTDQIIFDQHFRQRDRLGRLLYAIAMHPGYLGVGVDENTAAIIENETCLRVVGQNAVTVVDGRTISATNVAEISRSQPVAVSGATVHVLTEGCAFDLRSRQGEIPKLVLE